MFKVIAPRHKITLKLLVHFCAFVSLLASSGSLRLHNTPASNLLSIATCPSNPLYSPHRQTGFSATAPDFLRQHGSCSAFCCPLTSCKIRLTDLQQAQQSRQFNNGYNLPNGTPNPASIPQTNAPATPQGRIVQANGSRILCIADVRGMPHIRFMQEFKSDMLQIGNLRSLNELARAARADFILHTGDFGFYDERSLDRIAEK